MEFRQGSEKIIGICQIIAWPLAQKHKDLFELIGERRTLVTKNEKKASDQAIARVRFWHSQISGGWLLAGQCHERGELSRGLFQRVELTAKAELKALCIGFIRKTQHRRGAAQVDRTAE
jgi:hypothetical protein